MLAETQSFHVQPLQRSSSYTPSYWFTAPSSWIFGFGLFYWHFLSCLCTEDFFVHYVFSFTLMLENDQAVSLADSGTGHIQLLVVGKAVTRHIHASHFEALTLAFHTLTLKLWWLWRNRPLPETPVVWIENGSVTVSKECGGRRLSP